MTDPFHQDAQRRRALMERVEDVRLALYMAHEKQDGAAALKALADAYQLLDRIEGSQLLHVGDDAEHSVAFAPPAELYEINARFAGRCKDCCTPFPEGTRICIDKSDRRAVCLLCVAKEQLRSGM